MSSPLQEASWQSRRVAEKDVEVVVMMAEEEHADRVMTSEHLSSFIYKAYFEEF
jgi:hypothetical protein